MHVRLSQSRLIVGTSMARAERPSLLGGPLPWPRPRRKHSRFPGQKRVCFLPASDTLLAGHECAVSHLRERKSGYGLQARESANSAADGFPVMLVQAQVQTASLHSTCFGLSFPLWVFFSACQPVFKRCDEQCLCSFHPSLIMTKVLRKVHHSREERLGELCADTSSDWPSDSGSSWKTVLCQRTVMSLTLDRLEGTRDT